MIFCADACRTFQGEHTETGCAANWRIILLFWKAPYLSPDTANKMPEQKHCTNWAILPCSTPAIRMPGWNNLNGHVMIFCGCFREACWQAFAMESQLLCWRC